jgi:hypothetical protein
MSTLQLIFDRVRFAFARHRKQRMALQDLMRLSPAKLDDLGIDAFALHEALAAPRRQEQPDAHFAAIGVDQHRLATVTGEVLGRPSPKMQLSEGGPELFRPWMALQD